MEIVIDFSAIYTAANQGPIALAWFIFYSGGWIAFAIGFMYYSYVMWLQYRQQKYYSTIKFVILAIDVPKDTEQTPKAVEQLFSTLSGAHTPLNAREIYWEGKFQLSFSFEIVSIDGYVQFLIRTPEQLRDVVESSIYSQYPDAEITEVEDYVNEVPTQYPNDTHNVWGTEVILAKKDVYPIRTYRFFEDSVSGEFKDPIASLLETMSKIQVGEQVWIQILIRPTDFKWIKESEKEAYKIAGKKIHQKESTLGKMMSDIFGIFFLSTGETWFFPSGGAQSAPSRDKKEDPSMMLHLTPGERSTIEAVEEKAGKNGFLCKMRLVYISPLEQYSTPRVISSVFGSIKQFNTLDLNAFKPDPATKTQINYFFIEFRKNWRRERIVRSYKGRSGTVGHSYFILNTEELATVWHFPNKFIKAPMLQRTESKKSEPPFSLPRNIAVDQSRDDLSRDLKKQLHTNHPISVDISNKYFEERFAKKDSTEVKSPSSHHGAPPGNLPTA